LGYTKARAYGFCKHHFHLPASTGRSKLDCTLAKFSSNEIESKGKFDSTHGVCISYLGAMYSLDGEGFLVPNFFNN
jgi:hypothetical protein